MLRAVTEAGVFPDLVVGTSAGALNGAVLAEDPDGAAQRLSAIWTGLRTRVLIPDSRVQRLRNLGGRRHLYRDVGLRRLFEQTLASTTFDALPTPLACVATDLDSGEPAVLREGPLVSALLASCAVPGVFPMVLRDGRRLADGLCVANLPVRQALELGAASIVAFDGRPAVQPPHRRGDVRDTVSAAFAATVTHQTRCDLAHARAAVPTLILPGQPQQRQKAFDFSRSAQTIENAHHATCLFLPGDVDVHALTPASIPSGSAPAHPRDRAVGGRERVPHGQRQQ
ncbi:NTE family protein [Pseudonocardia oroxyli]|uniref:NTE family protein n=2 Tax=Pseudonocardia oroxyli TaxID=366584 RepID=A0A1G8BCT0_PSEOR|nr:NTE family protein [Pseudonocardia oroxyli]